MAKYIVTIEQDSTGDQVITDMQELIYCRDCVYFNNPERCIVAAYAGMKNVEAEPSLFDGWFCADGTKTEGETRQ